MSKLSNFLRNSNSHRSPEQWANLNDDWHASRYSRDFNLNIPFHKISKTTCPINFELCKSNIHNAQVLGETK